MISNFSMIDFRSRQKRSMVIVDHHIIKITELVPKLEIRLGKRRRVLSYLTIFLYDDFPTNTQKLMEKCLKPPRSDCFVQIKFYGDSECHNVCLSRTHLVSKIRHQHRCNPHNVTFKSANRSSEKCKSLSSEY